MRIYGCRGLAAGVHSASANRHRTFQQSLLSVRILWAVEACAYRWAGSDRGLSLLLCGKSIERGHQRKIQKNKKYSVSVWDIHRCDRSDYPCMGGNHGMGCHLSGAADRNGGRTCGGHRLSERDAPRNSAAVSSDAISFWHPFCDAACRKNALSEMDACVSSGHMEPSAGRSSGYCTGDAGAGGHMDVRYEPEQHE